jgi:hypothetical protein
MCSWYFSPKEELKKFLLGLMNSLLFAGCSSMIVRRVICLLTKYSSYNWSTSILMQQLLDILQVLQEYPSFLSPTSAKSKFHSTVWQRAGKQLI